MADIKYRPIWSEDGRTLTNVLVKDKYETYNVVTEWYDGTPMDDTKIDSDLVYVKYEGKYLVRNFEYGQVLQKDTMQEMRDTSPYEILLLKMGVYKHIQLNGYYEKGDTPAPIDYKLSNTTEDDDGGSVIEVGDVKLEHEFAEGVSDIYYGVEYPYTFDGWDKVTDSNTTEGKLIKDEEGVIYLFYRKSKEGFHNHNEGFICYKKSLDEGGTWGEERVAIETVYDPRNFVVGYIDGNITLIYRLIDAVTPTQVDNIGVYYVHSSDRGGSWSTPVLLDREGSESVIPFGRIIKDGLTHVFSMYAQRNPNSTCHFYETLDGGRTWKLRNQVYSLPLELVVAEPVIEKVGNGYILLARNSEDSNLYNIYQSFSEDGYTFTELKGTNIYSDRMYIQSPVWVDYIGNNYIVVYCPAREGTISDGNLSANMKIYKSKLKDVMQNPKGYKEIHSVDRPYANYASTYGYPSTVEVSYGYLGCYTERSRVDNMINTLASSYQNEKDEIYTFKMVESRKGGSINTIGTRLSRSKHSGLTSYLRTDNNEKGQDLNLYNKVWMLDVKNPTKSGVRSSSGRVVSLYSANNPSNEGWPQDAQGGVAILAQTSETGSKFLIGRGTSNSDQGTVFINTFNSSNGEWSDWKKVLVEGDAYFIRTSPVNISWDDIDKTKAVLVSTLQGSPPGGVSTHGMWFPQGITGATGTKLAFRNGRAWLRNTNQGVEGEWIEIITQISRATLSTKGVVNSVESVEDIDTQDATDEASAITLVNSIKAKFNEVLVKMRTAGLLEE